MFAKYEQGIFNMTNYENHTVHNKLTKRLFKIELTLVFGTIIFLLVVFLANKFLVLSYDGIRPLLVYGILVLSIHLMVFSHAILKYRDLAKTKSPLAFFPYRKLPTVSCMVAVHNEEDFISKCLDSIYDQTYPKLEVIVVNDASTDKTLAVLKKYKKEKHSDLVIIDLKKNLGKKSALCHAMARAKGTIFAHTDSDSKWDTHAIARVVRIMMNYPDVGAVSGHGRAQNAGTNLITKMQDAWMEGQFSIRKAFESSYGSVTCVSGPLAVFRKEAVYNLLPLWENDTFLGQEFRFATDRTLTALTLGSKHFHKKILKKYEGSKFLKRIYEPRNWKVVYSKSSRSVTIVPDNVRSFMKQQARWKKSFVRNVFFNSPFFWKRPLPVAFLFYAHIIFVFLAPVIVASILFLPSQNYVASLFYYVASVSFIGLLFGATLRLEDKTCKYWYYRPVMSLVSSLVLSWLIIYSAITIKKMRWHRGNKYA